MSNGPLCRIREIHRLICGLEESMQQSCGVGFNEGMLLCTLSHEGRCSSGRVAELLGLSASNASKVIASVEKKGLVGRIVDQGDRRRMLFALTPHGERCMERIKCDPAQAEELLEKIKIKLEG